MYKTLIITIEAMTAQKAKSAMKLSQSMCRKRVGIGYGDRAKTVELSRFLGLLLLSFEESRFGGTSLLDFNEAGFFDGANLDMRGITLEDQSKAVFPYTIFDEHSGIDCTNATLNDRCEVDFPDTDLGVSSFAWTKLIGLARLTIGRSHQPVDLSRVSFLHADVKRIEFGNVVWGTRPRGSVVDESVLTKIPFQSYVHVAELYRALRQNYESQLRFNEASDFFVRV